MLKNIPSILTPDLLKILMEMGHGDRIVIGDGNFPHASIAGSGHLVRLDGHGACEVLDAILQLMPLDTWVDSCVFALGEESEGHYLPAEMTREYQEIIRRYEPEAADSITLMDRFAFYDIAKESFAVVATGETRPYGCIILQKGVR